MEFTKFEELKRKIENGSYENADFMWELVDCVQKYTEGQWKQIKDGFSHNFYGGEKAFGAIVTALCDKRHQEELEQAGFYDIDHELFYLPETGADLKLIRRWNKSIEAAVREGQGSFVLGYTFLECDYRKFCYLTESYDRYTGMISLKNGKKTEFSYQLVFSDRLLQKEKIIKYCGELYGITAPIVFLPLARRLVEIQVDIEGVSVDNDVIERIDLQTEENHLNGILSLGKYAVWNIRIQSQDLDVSRAKVNPLGGERHFSYVFDGCKKGQYVVPLKKCKTFFDVQRRGDKIQFRYLEEYIDRFAKITVNRFLKNPETPYWFSNSHAMNQENMEGMEQLIKERLRSEADILFAIKQHGEQLGLILKEISGTKLGKYQEFEKYRRELLYNTVEQICLKFSKAVYLYFDNKDHSIFADDYMNYLCDYLSWIYPDITWRGGYC